MHSSIMHLGIELIRTASAEDRLARLESPCWKNLVIAVIFDFYQENNILTLDLNSLYAYV